MSQLIEVKNIKYRYAKGAQDTLQIAEFSIQKGERVFLYGPSGSGKTTFLEVLAGILKVDQGEVRILGHDLSQMSERSRDHFRAEHLGYIFQSFNLIPYLSVQENIELPLHLSHNRRERLKGEDATSVLRHLCTRLGIITLLDKNVTELSVGQQQRVAVARALFGRPEFILADEPTSSLDMDHRERFLGLMFELCEQYGTTVLFVSHDRTIQHLFSRSVSLDSVNLIGKGM
ncbi:MAG TPA: ABC transporter ATP-binding protein [Pseudobdellovibrionaceae bacterium]|jgi:putative ABC transport system ATP-binding protein